MEGGERRGRRDGRRLFPPATPANHNLRVLDPQGSHVVGDRLLANRSQTDNRTKVLSGWPHRDHSPPWQKPRFINHKIVHSSNTGGDFKENQSKQHMGAARSRNALRYKEVSSSASFIDSFSRV